jgi:hypothetical protein
MYRSRLPLLTLGLSNLRTHVWGLLVVVPVSAGAGDDASTGEDAGMSVGKEDDASVGEEDVVSGGGEDETSPGEEDGVPGC